MGSILQRQELSKNLNCFSNYTVSGSVNKIIMKLFGEYFRTNKGGNFISIIKKWYFIMVEKRHKSEVIKSLPH